jgi:hypothetical protein
MTEVESKDVIEEHELALDYLRKILLAPVYDVAIETELTQCVA